MSKSEEACAPSPPPTTRTYDYQYYNFSYYEKILYTSIFLWLQEYDTDPDDDDETLYTIINLAGNSTSNLKQIKTKLFNTIYKNDVAKSTYYD